MWYYLALTDFDAYYQELGVVAVCSTIIAYACFVLIVMLNNTFRRSHLPYLWAGVTFVALALMVYFGSMALHPRAFSWVELQQEGILPPDNTITLTPSDTDDGGAQKEKLGGKRI